MALLLAISNFTDSSYNFVFSTTPVWSFVFNTSPGTSRIDEASSEPAAAANYDDHEISTIIYICTISITYKIFNRSTIRTSMRGENEGLNLFCMNTLEISKVANLIAPLQPENSRVWAYFILNFYSTCLHNVANTYLHMFGCRKILSFSECRYVYIYVRMFSPSAARYGSTPL